MASRAVNASIYVFKCGKCSEFSFHTKGKTAWQVVKDSTHETNSGIKIIDPTGYVVYKNLEGNTFCMDIYGETFGRYPDIGDNPAKQQHRCAKKTADAAESVFPEKKEN